MINSYFDEIEKGRSNKKLKNNSKIIKKEKFYYKDSNGYVEAHLLT